MLKFGSKGEFPQFVRSLLQTEGVAITVKDREEYLGRAVIPVSTRMGANGVDFFVDSGRGYLPLRTTVVFDEKVAKESVVTDIKEIAGVGWFPMRCVKVSQAEGGVYDVLELRVESLEVGPVSGENFAIDLPAGTAIQDREVNSLIVLNAQEQVGIDGIEDLQRRVSERAAGERVHDPAGPMFKLSPITWGFLAVGTLLIVAAIVLLAGKGKRRS
jgi:hypothetical protein